MESLKILSQCCQGLIKFSEPLLNLIQLLGLCNRGSCRCCGLEGSQSFFDLCEFTTESRHFISHRSLPGFDLIESVCVGRSGGSNSLQSLVEPLKTLAQCCQSLIEIAKFLLNLVHPVSLRLDLRIQFIQPFRIYSCGYHLFFCRINCLYY